MNYTKISKQTSIKIKKLMLKDYEQQLEVIKNNKNKKDYEQYRKKYLLLKNRIMQTKKYIAKEQAKF